MSRRSAVTVIRGAALLTLGALAVHQLRYLLAYGPSSGEALHREGHGYLAEALPILVALAVALLAAALVVGALARSGGRLRVPSTPGRALLYTGALLCVFASQELVEGALAPGHPAGLAALVGGGGWIAGPLALGFGVLAAIAERLLDRAEEAISAKLLPSERPPPAADPPAAAPWEGRSPLAAAPLAFGLARRPPPAPARP